MAVATPESTRAKLVCTEGAVFDIELRIRHGTALKLRNVKWHVTRQHMSKPLHGRPILEALELNTPDLPAAAADRFTGIVDVDILVGSFITQGDRRLASVMKVVFHEDGGERREENIGSTDEWCDIEIETNSGMNH